MLCTDETWQAVCLPAYTAPGEYDGFRQPDKPTAAERIANRWHCLTSPVPPCTEHLVRPQNSSMTLAPGETVCTVMPMDMIYTGYPVVQAEADGEVEVRLRFVETDEKGSEEHYVFVRPDSYCGTSLHSAGKLIAEAVNRSGSKAELQFGFLLCSLFYLWYF